MDEIIFSDFGIEIMKRADRYYLRYDEGELVVKMEEIEITKEEFNKVQKSEHDAYDVILLHQRTIKG